MTRKQTVWLISWIVLLVCLFLTLLIYLYTGQIFIAILIAPPIIHWVLNRYSNQKEG